MIWRQNLGKLGISVPPIDFDMPRYTFFSPNDAFVDKKATKRQKTATNNTLVAHNTCSTIWLIS